MGTWILRPNMTSEITAIVARSSKGPLAHCPLVCIFKHNGKRFRRFASHVQLRRQLRRHVRRNVTRGPTRRDRAYERVLLRGVLKFPGKHFITFVLLFLIQVSNCFTISMVNSSAEAHHCGCERPCRGRRGHLRRPLRRHHRLRHRHLLHSLLRARARPRGMLLGPLRAHHGRQGERAAHVGAGRVEADGRGSQGSWPRLRGGAARSGATAFGGDTLGYLEIQKEHF